MEAKNSRRWDYFFTMGRLWMVLVMFVSWLSPVYSDPSQEEISYFVTLPTEKSLFSPYEEAPEYETESPITTMQPNSARLQQYEDDAKISFLADVPEVVGELEQHQKFKSLVDLPLFPNTRTGTVTGRTVERSRRPGAQNYRGDDDNVDNDRISGKDDDDEGKLGLIVRPKQNQENIGSRHSSVSNRYRPDRFPSLPPRQRPRPRPPLSGHHVPGSSVIDKERIFHNDIYPGRPGGNLRRPPFRNMTRVTHIEAECQDDFMRIHVQFNGTFDGLIYSSGYAYDGECIYVNGSGRPVYEFYIQLNRCGTLSGNEKGKEDVRGRTPTKNVMWNTLTVQYNALIEEEWDEHFKVTCEYGYDFWKTVTFPFLDVEVQTGNPVVFTLTPPECHMEIRHGFGTTGGRVSGPVRVGDPLTLVIYMRSDFEGFDIVVSDCYAHNGGNKKITLIDHYGCPVDEKLISHFEGTWTSEGIYETQVYAFMKTFRFTGSPALYIECDVRMCHGNCPTQPCHWRTGKKERRSISEADGTIPASNVSESLSLFQSIQVVRDDHLLQNPLSDLDEVDVCLKTGTVSALGGMVAVVVGLLTVACGVMCMRLRRMKKQEDAHHPGSSNRPHSMTFVPPYKSDFVPPVKRRLE